MSGRKEYDLRTPWQRYPLQEPTDAERIAALERRVAELERRLKPLDCVGPDSRQGRGKAGA